MDVTERQILRAKLVASGIIRYWQFDKSRREVDRWLEVMAEELAGIEESNAALKVRENLLTYGLRVPEVSRPVHVHSPILVETTEATDDVGSAQVRRTLTKADTQTLTVHSSATSKVQSQANLETSENGDVYTPLRNICTQDHHPPPVHSTMIGTDEIQQNNTDNSKAEGAAGLGKVLPVLAPQIGKGSTGSWTWRNWSYNRVPPAIEEAIREKFKEGWSKSKLAREFRLNRRTIIRICSSRVGEAIRNDESNS